jgi:hypothetical protein
MKKIAKSLVVVGAMLAAGVAAADMDMDFKPFIGVDYLHAWTPAKNSIDSMQLKNAFPKAYPGFTGYVGAKFTDCFGVELGYDRSVFEKKKKTSAITQGKYTSKVHREGFHADLVGFIPMDCWELFGSLGIGSLKMKIHEQVLTPNAGVTQAQINTQSPLPFYTKRKTVLRAGIGASYMITEMFGMRAKLGWEGTNNLHLKDKTGNDVKGFKNSNTVAVGAFVRF